MRTLTIEVTVQPNASRTRLRKQPDGSWRASLTAPPVKGAANQALLDLLAGHFRIPKSNISLVKGKTSRQKTVKILTK